MIVYANGRYSGARSFLRRTPLEVEGTVPLKVARASVVSTETRHAIAPDGGTSVLEVEVSGEVSWAWEAEDCETL